MFNDKKVTFRCKGNPRAALFTPQFQHDLAGMRQHPEWEEVTVDEHGNVKDVIVQFEDSIHRPTVAVAPAPAPKKAPKKKA